MHSAAYAGYGHQQRMYPPHGMPPPGMMRQQHQQGPPHHGLPPNARQGDWMCRACNNHNYADKTACNRCKVPKDVYIAATGMRVGDWLCPACSNHNFKDKVMCNKCAGPRPATIPMLGLGHGMGGSSHGHELRPGDWMCRHCNNHNYADKMACNRCRTPIASALSSNGPMSATGWPAGPAVSKRFKPTPIDSDPSKVQFELRYFPVCAKGLGPALVAEHSGLRWVRRRPPFSFATLCCASAQQRGLTPCARLWPAFLRECSHMGAVQPGITPQASEPRVLPVPCALSSYALLSHPASCHVTCRLATPPWGSMWAQTGRRSSPRPRLASCRY